MKDLSAEKRAALEAAIRDGKDNADAARAVGVHYSTAAALRRRLERAQQRAAELRLGAPRLAPAAAAAEHPLAPAAPRQLPGGTIDPDDIWIATDAEGRPIDVVIGGFAIDPEAIERVARRIKFLRDMACVDLAGEE